LLTPRSWAVSLTSQSFPLITPPQIILDTGLDLNFVQLCATSWISNDVQFQRHLDVCHRRATLPDAAAAAGIDRMLGCLVTGLCRKVRRRLVEKAPCWRPRRLHVANVFVHVKRLNMYHCWQRETQLQASNVWFISHADVIVEVAVC